ncbi:glutaminyl-peptide cyclotransferase [Brevundimonas bacteroides]|uniref:glutaminyl-peptide cyclotransferase n=1 Tax=Brevundimonas bacteroides TaxID=74311 RepID=UPI000494E815|nr:glutaminyl-peptide cyclotransferase [Brevundimonas bacteroides]
MRLPGLGLALVLALALAAGPGATLAQTPAPAAAQTVAPPVARPPRQGYEVVAVHPHDPTAFTQGLVFRNGEFLESTGRYPSTVRRVRLQDGEVLVRRELDTDFFGEGLTVLGDRAFSLTWQNGKGFIWNPDTLEPLGEFAYAGEGWGLTHDGARLILSDGTARLRFLDPQTFVETGSVTVNWQGRPIGRLNELEFIDGEVWANVWQTDAILRIDSATGNILSVIDLSGLLAPGDIVDPNDEVLNGIAWDPTTRRLFVTGKNWPKLFEIRVTPAG